MKAFKIGDINGPRELIIAKTSIRALQIFCEYNDSTIEDFGETEEVEELPECGWSDMFINDDDSPAYGSYLSEWMKRNPNKEQLLATIL